MGNHRQHTEARRQQALDKLLAILDLAKERLAHARLRTEYEELSFARDILADVSNTVDEAMHAIDKMLEPDPTPYDDPHCP